MGIAVVYVVRCMLLAGVGRAYGQNASGDDPRSTRAIFEKIYGKPVGATFPESRSIQRASSTQYPMIASTLVLKQSHDQVDEYITEFKAGGVIITEKLIISACSYFFVSDGNNTLIKIEDDPGQSEEKLKYTVMSYLIRAGNFFIPNVTKPNNQELAIHAMIAHPKCAESLYTINQFKYDAVALELDGALKFNKHVKPASFYSWDLEFVEDKIEEMQETNNRCHLLVATSEDEVLYASRVQMVNGFECNTLLCMIGAGNGKFCNQRDDLYLYNTGIICALSIDGDAPCEIRGGVLLCERQVFGMVVGDFCKVCAPHFIAKPMAMTYLAKKFIDGELNTTETSKTPEQERSTASSSIYQTSAGLTDGQTRRIPEAETMSPASAKTAK